IRAPVAVVIGWHRHGARVAVAVANDSPGPKAVVGIVNRPHPRIAVFDCKVGGVLGIDAAIHAAVIGRHWERGAVAITGVGKIPSSPEAVAALAVAAGNRASIVDGSIVVVINL